MVLEDDILRSCSLLRRTRPLVVNITNYVAMNFSANALTALGASPLMSFCKEEMEDLMGIADSLVVNIGCLDRYQVEAMRLALSTALKRDIPWVLDPVGVGASRYRYDTCMELIETFHPSVIRGNAGEILTLACADNSQTRGVDSQCPSPCILDVARSLSRRQECVVVASGEKDLVVDGQTHRFIEGGDGMMPRVTAMGCTASAVLGAFLAVEPDPWAASLKAMTLMKRCGEMASSAMREHEGTGSFMIHFLDALSRMDG